MLFSTSLVKTLKTKKRQKKPLKTDMDNLIF